MKELKPYLDFAESNDIAVDIYRCTGTYQNVHGVPDDVVEAKRNQMELLENETII
jgi:hypothetical protein